MTIIPKQHFLFTCGRCIINSSEVSWSGRVPDRIWTVSSYFSLFGFPGCHTFLSRHYDLPMSIVTFTWHTPPLPGILPRQGIPLYMDKSFCRKCIKGICRLQKIMIEWMYTALNASSKKPKIGGMPSWQFFSWNAFAPWPIPWTLPKRPTPCL